MPADSPCGRISTEVVRLDGIRGGLSDEELEKFVNRVCRDDNCLRNTEIGINKARLKALGFADVGTVAAYRFRFTPTTENSHR
jgi:hypothetical protein